MLIFSFLFEYSLSTSHISESPFDQSYLLQINQSECTYDKNYSNSLFSYNTVCLILCNFHSIQSDLEGGAVIISLKTHFKTNNHFINCTFTNCKSKYGGAVYITNEKKCTTEIKNCIFQGCKSNAGGSIYMISDECTTSISDCKFERNTASSESGGSIYIKSKLISHFKFTNCLFERNSGYKIGGAIYFHSLISSFEKCVFEDNVVKFGGGAVASSDSYISCADCLFDKNKVIINSSSGSGAFTCGGAFLLDDKNATFERCNFTENFVEDKEPKSSLMHTNLGGAIKYSCNYGKIDECFFVNNKVISLNKKVYGGAISDYVLVSISIGDKKLNITRSTFISNKAQSETETTFGGAISLDCVSATFTEDNFINNKVYTGDVLTYGGAIYLQTSRGNISRCNFTNNLAETKSSFVISGKQPCSYGGAIYYKDSNICFNGCSFTNNTGFGNSTNYISAGAGGAIYCSLTIDLISCIFNNNTLVFYGLKFDIKSRIYGGACYFIKNANLFNCSFINNSATLRAYENSNNFNAEIYGGAIYLNHVYNGGAINCSNCLFLENSVSIPNHQENEFAGAIFLCKGMFNNCNFTDNIAHNGCDIYYDQITYFDGKQSFSANPSLSINNTLFMHNSIKDHQLKSLIFIHANSSHTPINVFTNNKVVSEISAVLFDGKIEKNRKTNHLSILRFIINNNCMSPFNPKSFISDDLYFYNSRDNKLVTFEFAFSSSCLEKHETTFIQTQTKPSFVQSISISIPVASSPISNSLNNSNDIGFGLFNIIYVLFIIIIISQVVIVSIIIFAFIVILKKTNNGNDIDPLLINA